MHALLQWNFRDGMSLADRQMLLSLVSPSPRPAPVLGFLAELADNRFFKPAVCLGLLAIAGWSLYSWQSFRQRAAEPAPVIRPQVAEHPPEIGTKSPPQTSERRVDLPSESPPCAAGVGNGVAKEMGSAAANLLARSAAAAPPFVATLTAANDCLWSAGKLPTTTGSRLTGGTLNLAQGVAEITFDRGAKVVLNGPCTLELQSDQLPRSCGRA